MATIEELIQEYKTTGKVSVTHDEAQELWANPEFQVEYKKHIDGKPGT